MCNLEDVEKMRELVLEMGLPRHDFAMWGLMCPYCGKNDRIYKLEEPAEIGEASPEYRTAWEKCCRDGDLVLCKFCRQLLSFNRDTNRVSPLTDIPGQE